MRFALSWKLLNSLIMAMIMKTKITLCILLLPLTVATTVFAAKKANRVAVNAQADPEYVKSRATDPSKKIQTYHVIEGKYFGGNTSDKSMKGVTFMDIAANVSANLRRQNFYSEKDPAKGDILLMISYGATDYDPDYMELVGVDSIDDFGFGTGAVTEELDEFEAEAAFAAQFAAMQMVNEGQRVGMKFKAKILGLEQLFSDGATEQEVYQFRDMVSEERFFIFLIAFDLPAYRNGEKKVLWTTRYSMRAIGQDFDEAIGELNYVASNYFGKDLNELASRRATDESEVKLGEIEVLGEEKE